MRFINTLQRRLIIGITFVSVLFYLLVLDSYVRPRTSALTYDQEIEISPIPPPSSANDTTATNRTSVLLVSAMFPLAKSKHTKAEYADWLSRFLQPITTDVYFYTTPDMEATVRAARGKNLSITINTTYTSPFDIPPLRGLEDTYSKMHNIDRERKIHSAELYAVWNAKPFFLDEAVRVFAQQGSEYDFAFWVDAGSFRDEHAYMDWPNRERLEQVWELGSQETGTKKEDLLFFPIAGMPGRGVKYWTEDMGPVDYEFSEGSFFGGTPSTVSWWSRTFYTYHNHYLSLNFFVGKDQTLINAIFLLFPERIITVWFNDPDATAHVGLLPHFDASYLGACGSEWYYYQFWLAGREERAAMRDIWLGKLSWGGWRWWKDRQRCRLTGVLGLENVLTRWFGRGWKPPLRNVV